MKVLSPSAHSVLDYTTVIFLALAPLLFDLEAPYSTAAYILAGGYLLLTLCTDTPLGVFRVVPFKMHGGFELVAGIVLIALPWLLGFANDAPNARNFFVIVGILNLGAWMITDWSGRTRSMMTDGGNRH